MSPNIILKMAMSGGLEIFRAPNAFFIFKHPIVVYDQRERDWNMNSLNDLLDVKYEVKNVHF